MCFNMTSQGGNKCINKMKRALTYQTQWHLGELPWKGNNWVNNVVNCMYTLCVDFHNLAMKHVHFSLYNDSNLLQISSLSNLIAVPVIMFLFLAYYSVT